RCLFRRWGVSPDRTRLRRERTVAKGHARVAVTGCGMASNANSRVRWSVGRKSSPIDNAGRKEHAFVATWKGSRSLRRPHRELLFATLRSQASTVTEARSNYASSLENPHRSTAFHAVSRGRTSGMGSCHYRFILAGGGCHRYKRYLTHPSSLQQPDR